MLNKIYTINEIKELVAPIARRHGIERAYLFGSYARGEATIGSDIDLLIDSKKIKSLFELGGIYSDIEDAFNVPIDVVTTGNSSTAFLENIKKDEVLIYEQN